MTFTILCNKGYEYDEANYCFCLTNHKALILLQLSDWSKPDRSYIAIISPIGRMIHTNKYGSPLD